jgi:hypothetical protein
MVAELLIVTQRKKGAKHLVELKTTNSVSNTSINFYIFNGSSEIIGA